jgi:hypothetical protein
MFLVVNGAVEAISPSADFSRTMASLDDEFLEEGADGGLQVPVI